MICKRSHEDIAQRSISVILYNLACACACASTTASAGGGGGDGAGGGAGGRGVKMTTPSLGRQEKEHLTTTTDIYHTATKNNPVAHTNVHEKNPTAKSNLTSSQHPTSTQPPATTATVTTEQLTAKEILLEKENLSVMLANEHYINVMIQMLRDSKPEAQLVIAQAMRSLCIHPQVEWRFRMLH